jgi:hypothetical protein
LDFYDQLFNNASLGPVTSFSRCCFGGFSTDVDFRPDGSGTVAPTGAARSLDGNIIEFDFSQRPLMPGETAFYLMIKTDATLSDLRGTFDARSGKIGSSFKIPTNGSPEPVFPPPVPTPYGASLFLCAIGVGGMLISKRCVDRIRRRRSSASRTQRA